MNKATLLKALGPVLIVFIIAVNLAYFVSKLKANSDVDTSLRLSADQEIANTMANYIKLKFPDYKNRGTYFHASYLALVLDMDPTDPNHSVNFPPNGFTKGNIYIWDNWFSVVEGGMNYDNLCNDPNWHKDTLISSNEKRSGDLRQLALFVRK